LKSKYALDAEVMTKLRLSGVVLSTYKFAGPLKTG